MTIADYLSIPYIVVSTTIEQNGKWERCLSLPELHECCVSGEDIIELFQKLERKRIYKVLEAVQCKTPLPVPRPPLRSYDVVATLEETGFENWISRINEEVD